MRDRVKGGMLGLAALALCAGPAVAQTEEPVAGAAEGEWITLTGTIAAVGEDEFTLAYEDGGEIQVEMPDFDAHGATAVEDGDRVTVTGQVDDDFFDDRALEASAVYVERLADYAYLDSEENEEFFAAVGDEEPVAGLAADDEWLSVTGTVTEAEDGAFVIDTGGAVISVDTSDVESETIVSVGDRVAVSGEMDDADLFEDGEILASTVSVLPDRG